MTSYGRRWFWGSEPTKSQRMSFASNLRLAMRARPLPATAFNLMYDAKPPDIGARRGR
jgi:hypothetical protein